MSSLKQRLNEDVKQSMRSQDKQRLAVLRMITAAVKQREVDSREELDDTQVTAVLDKLAKQHRDSINQYRGGGRQDLADQEQYELDIVREYLPQPLTEGELETLIQEAIAEAGATSAQDMGKVMGLLKPRVQGRADMGQVSKQVKTNLS